MADDIIDFDGFEKYGPVGNLSTFASFAVGNFPNTGLLPTESFMAEWLSYFTGNPGTFGLIQGLSGIGIAFCGTPAGGGLLNLARSLPANYARIKVGFASMTTLGGLHGVELRDAGTSQVCCYVDTAGRILVGRGSISSNTVLYTSAALVLTSQRRYIELDVSIHNSTAVFEVKLDGVSLTTATGQNTRATANNFCNQIAFVGTPGVKAAFDDCYWRDNTGGTGAFLGDIIIDGLAPTADSAVAFSPALGAVFYSSAVQTVSTLNPGAGQIFLIPITPATNRTINNVSALPQTTSATAKHKAVIYSDSGGAPNALLSSGTEVVGCTTAVVMTGALVTPQALTGGTTYWIGFIGDTSIAYQLSDTWNTPGQRKANTYASGAPAGGPLTGMTTGLNPFFFWGGCTSVTGNVDQINDNPPLTVQNISYQYNQSSVVNDEDLFAIADLPTSPTTIHSVKVSVLAQRSDAGARTMDVRLKSGGTTSSGTNTGVTPPTTMAWIGSRYDLDPNTAAAWGAAGVNAITAGYKLIS